MVQINIKEQSMTWEDKTRQLVESTDIPASQICRDLGFDRSWLRKWLKGMIPDPGVNRIQKLHDYLISNK